MATIFVRLAILLAVVDLQLNRKVTHPESQFLDRLSSKITIGLVYLSGWLPFGIVNTFSLFSQSSTETLHNNLASRSTRLSLQGRILLVLGTSLSLLWFFVENLASIRFQVDVTWTSTCNFTIIPCDEIVVKAITILSTLWAGVLVLYAWNWMLYYGAELVGRLEDLMDEMEGLLLQKDGIILVQPRGGRAQQVRSLVTTFQGIQADFAKYSKIGGAYGLAVLIHLVLQYISIMHLIIDEIPEAEMGWGRGLVNLYILASFPCLVSVLHFGSYLTQSVRIYGNFEFGLGIILVYIYRSFVIGSAVP